MTKEYPTQWNKGDEPYYSVNDDKNNTLYTQYVELGEKGNNLVFGGRLGKYQYFDMDRVIFETLKLVDELG